MYLPVRTKMGFYRVFGDDLIINRRKNDIIYILRKGFAKPSPRQTVLFTESRLPRYGNKNQIRWYIR